MGVRFVPLPPECQRPRRGDHVKVELRLELKPGKERPSREPHIILFSGDS